MKTNSGVTLSRADMSTHCGIDPKTLDAWVRDGCPILREGSRGVPAEFNSAEVWRWREDRLRTKLSAPVQQKRDELELRKLEAQTVSAELELARARDEVALVAEFEKATSRLMAIIRTNMLNIPSRAALRLLGETNETAFKRVLREEITLALETSADADLVMDDDETDQ